MDPTTRPMRQQQARRPSIHIKGGRSGQTLIDRHFSEAFCIGRDESCEVRVEQEDVVSRRHAEVFFDQEAWWVRDLGSTNGTYLDNKRIKLAQLIGTHALRLGQVGPQFQITVERSAGAVDASGELNEYIRYYLETGNERSQSGKHTMMIRRAYGMVRRQQKRLYGGLIAAASPWP
ncbi:MAG: FHA domain-containing protein [Candidatus Aminicenantes bacterium]|nr:FHA domain-containing protein [Candidatus Aminicenantes bacterium]